MELAWWHRDGHGRVVCCITKSHVVCAHDEWLYPEVLQALHSLQRDFCLLCSQMDVPLQFRALGPLPAPCHARRCGVAAAVPARKPQPTMLADECPTTLFAFGPMPAMPCPQCHIFPLRMHLIRCKVLASLSPLRLGHRFARDLPEMSPARWPTIATTTIHSAQRCRGKSPPFL